MKTEKILADIKNAKTMDEFLNHMDFVLRATEADECDFTEWQFQEIQLAAREKKQQLTTTD